MANWYEDKNFKVVDGLELENGDIFELSVSKLSFREQMIDHGDPTNSIPSGRITDPTFYPTKIISLSPTSTYSSDSNGDFPNPYENPIIEKKLKNGSTLGIQIVNRHYPTSGRVAIWGRVLVKRPHDTLWRYQIADNWGKTIPLNNIDGSGNNMYPNWGASEQYTPTIMALRLWVDYENELAWFLGMSFSSEVDEPFWAIGGSSNGSKNPAISHELFEIVKGSLYVEQDPYEEDESGDGGGDRGTSMGNDNINIPSLPTISISDTGFITLYNPTALQLKNLASYMWTPDFFDSIVKLWADPMDVILNLSILPVQVPNKGSQLVKVGNIETNITMNLASGQFVELDCGSITIEKKWGSYLDYSPYTKIEIYLPYIGVRSLDTDEIMGKSVQVIYHIDIMSGGLVCFIKCGQSILYSFSGQCGVSIPITSQNFSNLITSTLQLVTSTALMNKTGGISSAVGVTMANSANTIANSKPTIEKSGAISGVSGFMAIPKPYLIINRPRPCIPKNQNKYLGYPSHTLHKISDMKGFTIFSDVRLNGISCTDSELDELNTLLKGGVIL